MAGRSSEWEWGSRHRWGLESTNKNWGAWRHHLPQPPPLLFHSAHPKLSRSSSVSVNEYQGAWAPIPLSHSRLWTNHSATTNNISASSNHLLPSSPPVVPLSVPQTWRQKSKKKHKWVRMSADGHKWVRMSAAGQVQVQTRSTADNNISFDF